VTVAHGDPLPVVLALRAHDPDNLFLHQFGEDAEADTDRQGQQPLPRRSGQLSQCLLHSNRQLLQGRGFGDRWDCLLHGGSSFELE
jgi:hypothetical protein